MPHTTSHRKTSIWASTTVILRGYLTFTTATA
jgi:hypothetical protein